MSLGVVVTTALILLQAGSFYIDDKEKADA
jgi:hypothetical protein